MWFALPFGAGCALCHYLLPEGVWLWTAAGVFALGLVVSFLLREKAGRAVRIAALGCAAGILWFSGYAMLHLVPGEELVGSQHIFEMELTAYPEETSSGARCEVRVDGLRGKAL